MARNISRKQGKLILNGVILEKHELNTISFFLNLGKDIELIRPSLTPRTKNADFIMDSLIWEMKYPKQGSKRSIERIFYEATKQSSNIVIDLRGIKKQNTALTQILEKCFKNTRRVHRLYIITSTQELIAHQK